MGAKLSGIISNEPSPELKTFDPWESYTDFSIPDDLLIDVLSFVPGEDLIKNCRLVCRLWKDTVDTHSLWKLKCERENIKIPSWQSQTLPSNFFQIVYFCNKSEEKNVLKNPCGEECLKHWLMISNGGDGFAVENPPGCAYPVPAEVGSQHCFVTSYSDCMKQQRIDLYQNKMNRYLLRSGLVRIKVGEWSAARHDYASCYRLEVLLLNESKQEIDCYLVENEEPQWDGQQWTMFTHTFKDVSRAQYVIFKHYGKDNQFWAGHYGSKWTGGFVKLCLDWENTAQSEMES